MSDSLQKAFYRSEELKEGCTQYSCSNNICGWLGAACDNAEGNFTLRAVIWSVDMVSINPEGARMIKSCFCCVCKGEFSH